MKTKKTDVEIMSEHSLYDIAMSLQAAMQSCNVQGVPLGYISETVQALCLKAQREKLRWQVGLPTKPGWYWRRMPAAFGDGLETDVVHVRNYAGELAIGNSTLKGWPSMARAEWAGPLQEPE